MKSLWIADAGCQTGFARVTHAIGERLVRDYGHEIHVLAINYRGDPFPSSLDPDQQTSLRLYVANLGNPKDIFGNGRVQELLLTVQPDAVVMINDPQVILSQLAQNPSDKERLLVRYRPILAYVPVDGYDLPAAWTDVLPDVVNVVAMSKFGQDQLRGSKLVYHGVDTELFHSVRESPVWTAGGQMVRTKKEAKEAMGYDPDCFLVVRVDSNSGRKDFPSTMRALAPVMARHKDIQVHLHTHPGKSTAFGTDLKAVASRFRDVDMDRWHYPDMADAKLWPDADLVTLYNAADLFVTTSRGEGFGFTTAEAAACAVPIIAQNVSAIPEVVGPGAVLLEPIARLTVPAGHDVCIADVDAFTEAIERLYLSPGGRRKLGEAGREHVKGFSWDFAAGKFDKYLRAMARYEGDGGEGVKDALARAPEPEVVGGGQ